MPDGHIVGDYDGLLPNAWEVFATAFSAGLKPDPKIAVDEWADSHRVLSSVSSSEPGPWRTDRTPYLREIMQELSPQSRTQRVVLMKGAQTGGSESGFNWIGHVVDVAPGPMMMVQPTVDTAKRVSKQRIDTMIEASPTLRDKIADARSRDSGNTVLMKEFPGGVLIMTGANSAVGLRSMPVRYLFLDEVDGYPLDADEEGDPVALAIQRTANFPNKKIFECSTPTVKGQSRIEKSFAEGDQRWFYVPCPECQTYQTIKWHKIQWPTGRPREAAMACEECGCLIPHHRKAWMLARGEWRTTGTGDGLTKSYHLSALYSPWVHWGEIANDFVNADKDPARLKPWTNTKLGETWEESDGVTVSHDSLYARREPYGPELPGLIVVLTCGVDVQDDRLELEIVGWGAGEESWSMDYLVIRGDPSAPMVWQELDEYLKRRWDHEVLADGLLISAACIDTGGHHTLTAYNFVRPRQRRRVWGIKGLASQGRVKPPVWPRRPSKNNKGKIDLYGIGVDSAKETIYARLRKKEAGAGYCHFPLHPAYDEEHFQGLTAEKMRTKFSHGFPIQVWHKPDGARNEPLDCRVYAYAALQGLISMGLLLNKVAANMQARLEVAKERFEEIKTVHMEPETPRPMVHRPKPKQRTVIRSGYMS